MRGMVVRLAHAYTAGGERIDSGFGRVELFEPGWGPGAYRFWWRGSRGRWAPSGPWEWLATGAAR